MEVQELPIIGYYDKQRFLQFGPSDCANWYIQSTPLGKKKTALYPTMGRRHVRFLGTNRLIFSQEPRGVFKSVNFWYVVVSNKIFRIDANLTEVEIDNNLVSSFSGDIFFDYLVVSQLPNQPSITFVGFTDGQHIYIYQEETGSFQIITDPKAPVNPTYIVAFGNRFAVAGGNTSQFNLSEINLGGSAFNPATAWTIASKAVFAQVSGVIREFAVLHNQLYIFTDFTTEIWSNIPSTLFDAAGTATTFPWKTNASNNWDFGLFDPLSLDVGFDRLTWMGQNRGGLIQVLASKGSPPEPISTTAISVLFQENTSLGTPSPFLTGPVEGFLYSWEDTVFYRLSAGKFDPTNILDDASEDLGNAIEYNFNTQTWHRVIEKNGQRNRIQKHVFFNNKHYVTLTQDNSMYEMSGLFYDNELTNPNQPDRQALDAYLVEPFRYERVLPIISFPDYSEFITEYVEIDFVWGLKTFINSTSPFPNAVFIIDEVNGSDGTPQFMISENPGPDGGVVYIITEDGNFPVADSLTYFNWFKPHIELYFSDDGGISYSPADVLEFSQLGVYQWRMRWYQLGASRNRVYKLICVSPSPIVVLGGVVLLRRASGGGN